MSVVLRDVSLWERCGQRHGLIVEYRGYGEAGVGRVRQGAPLPFATCRGAGGSRAGTCSETNWGPLRQVLSPATPHVVRT